MNEYGYPLFIGYDKFDSPLSRADFALLSIILGFFAAIMATSLGNANGPSDMVLRVIVTAIVSAGAIASLRGAILWGSSSEEARQIVESAQLSERAYEIDLSHRQSRAI
jgi:hypothetical protein